MAVYAPYQQIEMKQISLDVLMDLIKLKAIVLVLVLVLTIVRMVLLVRLWETLEILLDPRYVFHLLVLFALYQIKGWNNAYQQLA